MTNDIRYATNPWQSPSLRLAFYYGFLVTCVMIITVIMIYIRTSLTLFHDIERRVVDNTQSLTEIFSTKGLAFIAQSIEKQLANAPSDAPELYLLIDPNHVKVAGNLDTAPQVVSTRFASNRIPVSREGKPILGYVNVRELPDGSQLYVGSALRELEAFDSLIASSICISSGIAAILIIVGLFVFKLEMNESIEPLRNTLSQAGAGKIQARVRTSDGKDEFSLLGNDINRMLDRIEVLMNGVQHVSDTIAHNLRTPLTRILLRLRAWASDEQLSAEQRTKLDGAVTEIEDLITVFEKLLYVAEAEAGARRIEFEPFALEPVVHEVLDFYEVVAEQCDAQIHFNSGNDDNALILGDAGLMAQAISNLIDNALKYGGPHSSVNVAVEVSQTELALTVEDNGAGVPPDQLKQLGSRFLRLNRDIAGHGLGLAAVTAIVATHGGRLLFEDAQPGLVVRIMLPLHRP